MENDFNNFFYASSIYNFQFFNFLDDLKLEYLIIYITLSYFVIIFKN